MTECNSQFDLFSIGRRIVTASFVDTPLSSDIGAVLLGRIDRKHRVTERLAAVLTDRREASKVQHSSVDLLRQRAYQIACGYEDAVDGNTLRHDAGFQIALNRVPGADDVRCALQRAPRGALRARARVGADGGGGSPAIIRPSTLRMSAASSAPRW